MSADRATASEAAKQQTPSNNQGVVATWTGRPIGQHALVIGVDAQRVTGTAMDTLFPPMVQPDSLVARGWRRAAFCRRVCPGRGAGDPGARGRWGAAPRRLAEPRREPDPHPRRRQRDDHAVRRRSELQLDPRLGALVHVTNDIAVRASAYRAFRAPTLNELYRAFQVGNVLTATNDRLRPETLWGGELGTQIGFESVSLQTTAFWNQLTDPIANVTLAQPLDGATRQRQNLGKTQIFGLDLDLSWRPSDAWMVRVDHMFSDAHVTEAPAQPNLVGKRLAQDPHHRTTAAVSYDSPRLATIMAQVRYLGPQFEDDLNTQPIGAAVLVDARAERSLTRGFSLFVSGQNLFDRHYLVGRAGIDTEGRAAHLRARPRLPRGSRATFQVGAANADLQR